MIRMRVVDKNDKIVTVPVSHTFMTLRIDYSFHFYGIAQKRLMKKEAFIMILKNLLVLANKEKKKEERVKGVQRFAIGIGTAAAIAAVGVAAGTLFAAKSGKKTREEMKKKVENTVEVIKNTAQSKAEKIENAAANAAQGVCDISEDVQRKTEDVKKDIGDGIHEITKDTQRTAEHVLDELSKPKK